MVVTTDLVDNLKDIHSKNKLDVGKRLALWALPGERRGPARLALPDQQLAGRRGGVNSGPAETH